MQKKEDLIGYDFQGFPFFKMNLKEILCSLGGKCDDKSITFSLDDPYLNCYPVILIDDGMAYGIEPSYIMEIDRDIDARKRPYINIFRELVPSSKMLTQYQDRWDMEIREIKRLENDN